MDDELELLNEAISWVVRAFFHGNRQELMRWFVSYFEGENLEILKKELALNDPERIKSESALIAFLVTKPTRPENLFDMQPNISRTTDWGRTLIHRRMGSSTHYWSQVTRHKPDVALLSSILNICYIWEKELRDLVAKGQVKYEKRAQQLKNAIKSIRFLPLPVSYDVNMATLLQKCEGGKELKELLDKTQGALWKHFDQDADWKILRNIFLTENGNQNNYNLNLEIIATLAVVKCLTELDWQAKKSGKFNTWYGLDQFELTKGDWSVSVRKGFSKSIKDRTIPLLGTLGYSAQGKQPDIVICFKRQQNNDNGIESSYYMIGDAKRNEANGGESYIRSAFFGMLGDFLAFGHKLGLHICPNEDSWINCNGVAPRGILFFKQTDRPFELANFINPEQMLPVIVGLDLNQYGDIFTGDCQTLKNIFRRVEDQLP